MKTSTFALLAAIILFLPLWANATIQYKVIDLGTLGGADSWAYCINNSGQIVGCALDSSGRERATLFDPTGRGNNIELGTLGGNQSWAKSINNYGQIVGWAHNDLSTKRATLFDSTGNGNNIDLGRPYSPPPPPSPGDIIILPPFPPSSDAFSINDHGQIVGSENSSSPILLPIGRAALFDSSGKGNNLELGPGHASSISNSGQIVGRTSSSTVMSQAILFDPTGNKNNIDLGTIPDFHGSYANSVNDNGQIVGVATFESVEDPCGFMLLVSHAVLFDGTGTGNNIDLGRGEALSINNHGQIVGHSFIVDSGVFDVYASLFDPTGAGGNIDLNTLINPDSGWTLTHAYSINNYGWIVGNGINPDGDTHAFLLIPEPATLVLLGLGILCLRKRRK